MKRLSLFCGLMVLLTSISCSSAPKTLRAPCDDESMSFSSGYSPAPRRTVPCDDRVPVNAPGSSR